MRVVGIRLKGLRDILCVNTANIADGMKFARVPEPGACNWCLMLASRGAVYSKDSVGMTRATRFHDHCRCIGMEVSDSAPLPSVNRELEEAWQEATTNSVDQAEMYRDCKNHLDRCSKVLPVEGGVSVDS